MCRWMGGLGGDPVARREIVGEKEASVSSFSRNSPEKAALYCSLNGSSARILLIDGCCVRRCYYKDVVFEPGGRLLWNSEADQILVQEVSAEQRSIHWPSEPVGGCLAQGVWESWEAVGDTLPTVSVQIVDEAPE